MAAKGKLTESSPLSWDQFQVLISQMAYDIDHNFESDIKKVQRAKFILLIGFGCYCGLRIKDILNLSWSDILNKTSIEVIESKTKKVREITLNKKLLSLISRYKTVIMLNSGNNYIFTNRSNKSPFSVQYVNRHLKAIILEYNINIKNASSHTLRKTFGRRVFEMNYKSDEALITLAHIFNHSSTAITRKYIGLQSEKIKDVYLRI